MTEAQKIIAALGLVAHPEGGYYAETFRDKPANGARGALTQIFYLLAAGDVSAWHRVRDATEIWHWYAGAPLSLTMSPDGRRTKTQTLGDDIPAGQHPHIVIPPDVWQTAKSLGAWTLTGCTVAPAFDFSAFELAPKGWEPGNL